MPARHDDEPIERALQRRILRIDATLWGITAGILAGAGLFVATNWLVLRGGEKVGQHLALLGQYYPGYRVTFLGSLVGFAYAFATAFAATWVLAQVYNRVARRRHDGPAR